MVFKSVPCPPTGTLPCPNVVTSIPVGKGPTGVAIKPDDGSLALVTNQGENTVSVINTASPYFQFPKVQTDSEPVGIAVQDSLTFLSGAPVTPLNGVTGSFALTGINASLVGSVNWSFGNGAGFTSSALNTSYAYPSPGTYTARATVLDKSGGTLLTKTIPVQVQSPPQAIRTAAVHQLGTHARASLRWCPRPPIAPQRLGHWRNRRRVVRKCPRPPIETLAGHSGVSAADQNWFLALRSCETARTPARARGPRSRRVWCAGSASSMCA